ncbi:MAG: DUF177 domain-containing protein, partial [Eubacteriales bacterium]|nr:DUF177 domain-containing protein [Eubacteriales bacterium]
MKIDIADAVKNEGEMYTATYDGTLDRIEFLGESYVFTGGVHVDAAYCFDGEGIVVTGRFSADVPVACSRCLKPFLYPVGFEFNEYYKEQPQDGMYSYSGESIDLDQMLSDNVVMTLTLKFLCNEDCKGLCSVCG